MAKRRFGAAVVPRVTSMKSLTALFALLLFAFGSVPSAAAQGLPSDQAGSSAAAGLPDLSSWPKCEPVAVGEACFSPYWPGCNLWIVWTAIPAQPTCLYRSEPLVMGASASPWPGGSTPDVQCMDVYSEDQVPGTNYWLVRRDSCSAQLYECPEGYSPSAPPCREASLVEASSASAAPCYMVYTRNDVGTVSVVRRTSCSPPEVYQCPYEGAPIDRCEPVLQSLLSASAIGVPAVSAPPIYCMPYERHLEAGPLTVVQGGCGNDVRLCDDSVLDRQVDPSCATTVVAGASAAAYEPECLYYYRETQVGPVTHVQRDSCHSETYVCEDGDGVHESDETLLAFIGGQTTSPDQAVLQDCVRDTLDDYIAWG